MVCTAPANYQFDGCWDLQGFSGLPGPEIVQGQPRKLASHPPYTSEDCHRFAGTPPRMSPPQGLSEAETSPSSQGLQTLCKCLSPTFCHTQKKKKKIWLGKTNQFCTQQHGQLQPKSHCIPNASTRAPNEHCLGPA